MQSHSTTMRGKKGLIFLNKEDQEIQAELPQLVLVRQALLADSDTLLRSSGTCRQVASLGLLEMQQFAGPKKTN